MREDNKPGIPLQFYGCAPVANAQTIGPVDNWPLEVMQPCPRTGMPVIECGKNANGLWWRAADGSLHIGYQIGDHTTAQAMQGKAIQAAIRDLRVYMKAHADMDAGRSWQEVLTEIGFNEKRSYEFWEAYMVRRIMNHLRVAELEAARGYEELTRAKASMQSPADDTARPHAHPLADPYTAALYFDVEHYRRKWTTQLARANAAEARVAELEAQPITAQDAAQAPEIAALIEDAEKGKGQIVRLMTVKAKAYGALANVLRAIAGATP